MSTDRDDTGDDVREAEVAIARLMGSPQRFTNNGVSVEVTGTDTPASVRRKEEAERQ